MGEDREKFNQFIHGPAILEDGRPQSLDTDKQHCAPGGTFLLEKKIWTLCCICGLHGMNCLHLCSKVL